MNSRHFVLNLFSGIYRPRSEEAPIKWMSNNIVLSKKESVDRPGRYDPNLTPYHRIIFDAFFDPKYDEIVIRKSSQAGVTLAALMLITYITAERPANLMYVIDSRDEVRRIVKSRLLPMLKGCGLTANDINNSEDEGNASTTTIELSNMLMYFAGGGSVGQLANKTVKYVFADELEKHRSDRKEAPTMKLLRSRVKTVEGSKIMAFSSPATEDGETHQEYQSGTRHVLEIPCPHCGEYHELRLINLRFDHCRDLAGYWDYDSIERAAYFECPHCRGKILQSQKAAVLEKLRARQTNFGKGKDRYSARKFSLHISDFYSPFCTWGALAREFVEARGSPVDLKNFVNSRLGEVQEEKDRRITKEELNKLVGGYWLNHTPKTPYLAPNGMPAIFVASDVQQGVKKWARGAFCPGPFGADLYILDGGSCLAFDDLEAERRHPVICDENGGQYEASVGMIDEGFNTMDVRTFVLGNPRFIAAKGRGVGQARAVVAYSPCQHEGREMKICHFSDDDFKAELYVSRIYNHTSSENPQPLPRIFFPEGISEEFLQELTTERRGETWTGGKRAWKWTLKPGQHNDYGDAVKMLLVLWHITKSQFLPSDLTEGQEA